ncbi:MAG TPA: AraC family transcriptional regulator, partial [Phycisphaerae bacterium]|nr:AraC family transcriptional regulator [Phycisphaerae bacterium]
MKRLYLNFGDPSLLVTIALAGLGVSESMDPSLIDRPGGTGWFLLMHFEQSAEVFSDGAMRSVQAGTTILWEPGMRHWYGNSVRGWSHSWLSFQGTVAREAITASQLPMDIPVQLDAGQVVAHYLELMYEEVISHSPADNLILEGLVQLLLRDLSRRFRERGGAPALPEAISQVRRYVEDHLAEPLYLSVLAEHAGLSVPHFCAIFKQHMTLAPRQYVEQQRMRRAVHLLGNHSLSISDIAGQVGYNDPLY